MRGVAKLGILWYTARQDHKTQAHLRTQILARYSTDTGQFLHSFFHSLIKKGLFYEYNPF